MNNIIIEDDVRELNVGGSTPKMATRTQEIADSPFVELNRKLDLIIAAMTKQSEE